MWKRLLIIVLVGFLNGACVTGQEPSGSSESRHQAKALGADEISAANLPAEARGVLTLIKKGGPFRYAQDGTVFSNRERLLPLQSRGYYHEYTVPTPGAPNRGARRIIAGGEGEYYYTDDHYRTFKRIRE